MALMLDWIHPDQRLPVERVEVRILVGGEDRPGYYRIADRWYDVEDLDRWQMRTARSWSRDRAWYVKTEDLEGWQPM